MYVFMMTIAVVVDMNNMKSIELANSWKQQFANKVTKVKNVTETLPDGSLTSKMEMLPCDGTAIPVLLLGNKYDLVRIHFLCMSQFDYVTMKICK